MKKEQLGSVPLAPRAACEHLGIRKRHMGMGGKKGKLLEKRISPQGTRGNLNLGTWGEKRLTLASQ